MVDRGKSCGGQRKELWCMGERVMVDGGKSCGGQRSYGGQRKEF